MNLEHITSFLFAVHIALLFATIWSTFVIFGWFTAIKSSNSSSYMFVSKKLLHIALFLFSALVLSLEIHFLYAFFTELDLYFYEYVSVLDQIIFKIIAIIYLTREVKNHG